MKRIYLNFVSGVIFNVSSLIANHSASEFNIRMYDYSPITIVFDNMVFSNPSSEFHLNDVQPGKHFLKVIQYRPVPHCHWKVAPVTVFAGHIKIHPRSQVFARIDRFGHYDVIRTAHLAPPPIPVCQYGCVDPCAHQHFDYGDSYHEDYNGYSGNHWWNPSCHFHHINDYDFAVLKQTVASKPFESSRREIAIQAISANHFSARQVKELLVQFNFESTKLEVAKFAYGHTCDKGNFFVVNNAFTFSSSVDELNRFIVMR